MSLPPWRRNQIAVTVAAVLVFAGFTLVLPFLPYYVEAVGVRGRAVNVWSGVLLSVAPLLAALMAPVWGRLADRYGMKIMVQRTTLTMVIHWILMAFAQNVTHLLALRIFLGLFSGFATMSVALVTLGAPPEKTGSLVGTLQASQILAASAGPFFGGLLYETIGLRATCFVTALFCLAGFALISFSYDDRDVSPSPAPRSGPGSPRATGILARPFSPSRTRGSMDPDRIPLRSIAALPGFAAIAAVLFFATVISRSFGLVTPIVVQQFMTGAGGVGLLAGIAVSSGSLAEALSAMVQGRMSGRMSPQVLIFMGLLLASVAVLPMILARGVLAFTALRTLQGLVAGGTLTLGYTMAGRIIPESARATGYGLLSSAAMMGGAFGPVLAGLISYGFGMQWVFAAASVGYAGLAMVALAGVRRDIGRAGEPPASAPRPYIPVPR